MDTAFEKAAAQGFYNLADHYRRNDKGNIAGEREYEFEGDPSSPDGMIVYTRDPSISKQTPSYIKEDDGRRIIAYARKVSEAGTGNKAVVSVIQHRHADHITGKETPVIAGLTHVFLQCWALVDDNGNRYSADHVIANQFIGSTLPATDENLTPVVNFEVPIGSEQTSPVFEAAAGPTDLVAEILAADKNTSGKDHSGEPLIEKVERPKIFPDNSAYQLASALLQTGGKDQNVAAMAASGQDAMVDASDQTTMLAGMAAPPPHRYPPSPERNVPPPAEPLHGFEFDN